MRTILGNRERSPSRRALWVGLALAAVGPVSPLTASSADDPQVGEIRRNDTGHHASVQLGAQTADLTSLEQAQGDMEDARKLFDELTHAWMARDAEAIVALFGPAELRVALQPPRRSDAVGKEPVYSREQVFYMLEDFFTRHEVEIEEAICRCSSSPNRRAEVHGVLTISLNGDASSGLRRLYVGLRFENADLGWRVVELRALP